jgi:hypothetical protein
MRRDRKDLLEPGAITRSLGNLPSLNPPAGLRTSLRVIASRERQRRLAYRDWRSFTQYWRDRAELFFDNALRSLALPFAGGVFSTVILFSMFVVPAYPLLPAATADVPTMLTTEVSVKSVADFGVGDGDVVVDVSVDPQGRMIDYAVVAGANVLANADVRRRLENALVFSTFTPATSFGQPQPSRVRLWFHSSRVDVKG